MTLIYTKYMQYIILLGATHQCFVNIPAPLPQHVHFSVLVHIQDLNQKPILASAFAAKVMANEHAEILFVTSEIINGITITVIATPGRRNVRSKI